MVIKTCVLFWLNVDGEQAEQKALIFVANTTVWWVEGVKNER